LNYRGVIAGTLYRTRICAASNRGLGRDDPDLWLIAFGDLDSFSPAGADDANDIQTDLLTDLRQSNRRCGIAGDDKHLDAVRCEKL